MSLVSVIVPMRNAEPYISATLKSILQERKTLLEVLVIDDGSVDASIDRVNAISDQRIRLIDGPRQGISAALNLGLATARGDIIMRCDADDLYPPSRISEQVEWLTKHPDIAAVCGSYTTIDTAGRPILRFDSGAIAEEITDELRRGVTRTHLCTFAIRAEALRATGGFRAYFRSAEDIDLQLRLAEIGRIWYLPSAYYHYRLHHTSITHTQSNLEREFFEATAREFQVQRQTQGSDDLQRGCPPLPPQGSAGPAMTPAQQIQGFLIGSAWQEHQAGHKRQALTIGLRSILVRPSNLLAWRNLLVLAVKPGGRKAAL